MPLSDVDQRFMRDPLAFMKSISVQPQDYKDRGAGATALYNATPHSYNTDGPKAAYDSMLSVQGGDNRVAYTKLTERLNSGMKNHFDLFFYSRGVARTTSVDNYIASYFLPWTSDHLTRIQIPPKVPARAGSDVAKQRAGAPPMLPGVRQNRNRVPEPGFPVSVQRQRDALF